MNKQGHVIGLNLSRRGQEAQEGPPITIDGVPFKYVSDITVDAAPSKGIRVTVTFDASHLGGITLPESTPDAPGFDTSLTYPEETL